MPEHIGARIRYWRTRRGGMSQAALAGLAGVSQSYVSQVEAGSKGIERRSTLVAFAGALQVSVADLLGQPGDPTDPRRAEAAAAVPRIRVALVEIEEGERRPSALGPAELEAALTAAEEQRARSDYGAMAQALPALLHDAAAHGGLALARAGYETSVCLRNLGYRDLALTAARIAVAAAREAEDRAWIGAARFVHSIALPIEAAGTSRRVSDAAVADLQAAAADPEVRQMLGQLHLSASLACAVDGQEDQALTHLAAAAAEARTLGDPADGRGFNLSCFGPTNIAIWHMTVAAELGDFASVVELARSARPGALAVANRHQAYWLTLGRALAHSGRTDPQAVAAFLAAERAAPVPFSLNPIARDAVLSMVHRARRRAVPDDLRTVARRLGIDAA